MSATARSTDLRRVPPRIRCEFAKACLLRAEFVRGGGLTDNRVNRAVFVSFGGLLLYLEGPYKKLAPLRIDHVYLLLKK